ncbi:hypothetical protein QTO30_08800 [Yoonia sp. GPGPB17]|uniref:hypothetical protein n=1 Tax=Yoonia sp. GPGPB17 TaxID=3026147 RepID=UPI0030C5EA63
MGQEAQIAASDIAQALLEVTGNALMTGDFEAFKSAFHVPQKMATLAGPIHMETVEDMERAFREMCQHFKVIGLTEMIRTCVAAEYKSPALVESTHVAELLRNGKRLNEPYPVFSTLQKIDGVWKVTGSEYALDPMNGQALALKKADASHRPNEN